MTRPPVFRWKNDGKLWCSKSLDLALRVGCIRRIYNERWRSPSVHEIGFKKWTYWATLCQAICLGDKLRSRRFHIFHGHGNHLIKLNLTELGPWWMVWVRGRVGDFGWLWGLFLKMSLKMNSWSLEMYIIPAFAGKPWKIQNSSSSVACRWSRAALLGALRRCWNRMQSAANSSETPLALLGNVVLGWNMVKPKNENAIPGQSWIPWERNTSIAYTYLIWYVHTYSRAWTTPLLSSPPLQQVWIKAVH